MRILSLFDGISGCRQALKELNIDCDYYSSEIDRFAIQISKANHPDIKQIGDIKGVHVEDGWIFYNQNNNPMENGGSFKTGIDLLIGGFPCQSFSIAGNRKGFEDERGNLFFEALRILKEVKPKYFIFENVASMSKDNQDFISNKLGVKPVLINSDLFIQQNRPRLFWTNIKIDELPKRPEWDSQYYQWRRTYFRENKSGVCPALTANMGTGGHNVPLKSKNLEDKLSVSEVAELQVFPAGYCDSVSKSQGYKALGNSFTVSIIKHILKSVSF